MTSCGTILEQLIKDGKLSQVLRMNSTSSQEVQALNQILYELGFDAVRDPQTEQISKAYDDQTVATLKAFGEKNDIVTDGESVSDELAKMIIKRYDRLPDMLQLHQDLVDGKVEEKYFKGSTDKQAISALQNLLHDLGFKDELQWEQLRNNGEYGEATINAVKAFMDGKGEKVTKGIEELADKHGILKHACGDVLKHLMEKGGLSSILQKGAEPDQAIKELKHSLHHLGLGKILGQEFDQLDGHYTDKVVDAVKAFASKNGIEADGTKVTQSIAGALRKQLSNLPFMHQLQSDLREGKVAAKYIKGSKHKIAVGALQHVLNELGHGKILQWVKRGNDGVFDNTVVNALKAHFKKNLFSRVKEATPHMIFSLLKDMSKGLGPDWSDHVKQLKGGSDSVLTTFEASNFQGSPVTTNVDFVPTLQKINQYAIDHGVKLYITNSYRRGTEVPGAIVPPASMSNHKVGHAIDMNLIFGDGQHANSTYMNPSNRDNWAEPVRGFLDAITDDHSLRWGGNFHSEVDPVHIDDGLNIHDPDEWHKQRELTIKAYDAGDIREWES